MHPAPRFRETDLTVLLARMAAHPLALVAVNGEAAPLAVHTPVIARAEGDGAVLRFHLSAANRVTARLLAGAEATLVFTGPEAYISPDWYGEVPDQVPTWNYLSVEAEGTVTETGREGAAAFLDDLSAVFETALLPKPPWTRAKMKPAAFEAMLGGIRAFEMRPRRFEGITKLGQNKTPEMRAGVIDGLDALPGGAGIAGAMRGLDRG
ncbi:putative FMN-binding protein [Hyphomonas neptunium ATCC 15444]|uniref:Putative FMN-binding protein n=2 Tax=Hyphomonas TaxID=85 RepID=Q0C3P8_HYPNA|nr:MULTISPECIES: FMN-binding negative transcriptional regulator [Hyphomonas]ABI77801.1 putative FMN-binding protein [Hyphomonas neptunium ATCC 15444]KCZ96143.1 putative FMN-binding protein [Hyphomonas hirschiana VP5]